MSRPKGKTEDCTRADAATRLKQAELYLDVATLVLDVEEGTAMTVAAGNAVLAAIAASDAICCSAAGSRYRGPDHTRAANHLETVTGDTKLAGLLRDVVNDKDAAHYGLENIRIAAAKSCVRKAGQLVEAARQRTR